MNIINFNDKGRNKNLSKNKQEQKQFLLPSLNPKKEIQLKKPFLPFQCGNHKNQMKSLNNNITNQLKKQRNSIHNKIYEQQQQLLRNHKPYSGNPSTKGNNNNNDEYNKPLLNDNQFIYEREILTANPSLIASKMNFSNNNNNNYNQDNNKQLMNNIKLNNNTNKNQLLSMKNKNNSNNNLNNKNRNYLNGKEVLRENISAKYQYYQDKVYKCFRKMGIGISKSSPKISSIEIMSKQYECQKQKDNDYHKNLKYMNNNNNNYNYNNMIQIKKINMDSKNINELNKLLAKAKNKPINSGKNIGNVKSNAESQNMLMNAVGIIKLKLDKKHFNVKSASIIDVNNSMNVDSSKKKNNNIKILKNSSKKNSVNSINNQANVNIGLNNTALSTINNSSINRNNCNEINKNNKPKISKCFVSYAYHDHPNLEHRQEMEDFHCIKQALGKKPNISYFSIFDGHGGKEVASYLSLNYHRILSKEINSICFTTNDEDNINIIIEKIRNSFELIDQEILKNDKLVVDVGSTATIILIYYNNIDKEKKNVERFLICANVGDSNGYLLNKKYIKLITKRHNCDDMLEVKRIKDQGGIVFQGRIFGKLILTRTIGDKEMKKYGVIPEPDFYVKRIENEDIFIVIGSDGIWDVINQEETFRMGIEKGLSSEDFSQKLIKISEERDTRDNACCIVIKLNKNV